VSEWGIGHLEEGKARDACGQGFVFQWIRGAEGGMSSASQWVLGVERQSDGISCRTCAAHGGTCGNETIATG